MDDCTQEAMLRCMHVLGTNVSLAVGAIVTEKLTKHKHFTSTKYHSVGPIITEKLN